MRIFSTVALVIFGVILVVAVLILGGILPGFSQRGTQEVAQLTIWGPWPNSPAMQRFISEFNRNYGQRFVLTYTAKDPEVLISDYLSALARRRAPDLIFIDQDFLIRFGDTLAPVPAELVSERFFRDNFIEGTEVFWQTGGAAALPVLIDPLVMYYNRDLSTQAGLVRSPATWTQFLAASQTLTRTDEQNRLQISGTAMGEFVNIGQAKAILSMLLIQGRDPIIIRKPTGRLQVAFGGSFNQPTPPAEAAVNFFTQFVDPRRATFAWSRSRPDDRTAFQLGVLAHYFAPAGELATIRALNPNLNFDARVVPQADADNQRTFGRMIGIAVVQDTARPQAAWALARILATEQAGVWPAMTDLPPAHRDLLAAGHPDSFQEVFYRSATISRTWPDPEPTQTESIFNRMIQSVNNRQRSVTEAVRQAQGELIELIGR